MCNYYSIEQVQCYFQRTTLTFIVLQCLLMWFCHNAKGKLTLLQLLCEMVWHRNRCTVPLTTRHKVTLCQRESYTWIQRSTGWQTVHLCQAILLQSQRLQMGLWCAFVCLHPGWGGFTPLHYAALHGNRSMVDLFLSNGADPNMTCDAGQTAFHFACRWAVVAHLGLWC